MAGILSQNWEQRKSHMRVCGVGPLYIDQAGSDLGAMLENKFKELRVVVV